MLVPGEYAALQYSGGKDSTALLYMARPHIERITVFFCDPGAILPHVTDFVQETCRKLGANLTVVRPEIPVQEFINRLGLPTDIIPIENTSEFAPHLEKPKPLLQSMWQCCWANYFRPMQEAIKASGLKIVLRGSKGTDERRGAPDKFVEDGIEYRSPLWNWTHEQVFDFLKREGVQIPSHYETVKDSLDCWLCTGYLGAQYHGQERLAFIREHYPERWPELKGMLKQLDGALAAEMASIIPALNEAAR